MTKQEKNQQKADKAAEKARVSAEKQAVKDKIKADKAAGIERIKEPGNNPPPDEAALQVEVPAAPVSDSKTNNLGVKTRDCLNKIIRASDVCLNTNPDCNIQDQICSIIRTSLRAYELHTGYPFDTEIG